MNEYIKYWLRVIEGMQNDNTYKLAWGRAIVEICSFNNDSSDELVIPFVDIAELVLKYYWNQTFFFRLSQGPKNHIPKIQKITEELIQHYQATNQSAIPDWFEKAKPLLSSDQTFYNRELNKIANTLKQDVCWRFPNVAGEVCPIYELDMDKMIIKLSGDQVASIKEYNFILSQLLNYRWAQLLEKYNQAPRIISKVKGLSDETIRRSSLSKFKEILLLEYPDGQVKDFYSGDLLDPNDMTLDHVIPWSFMYSDDIWNLVITSKSNNSSKGNSVPTEVMIEHLKQRNNYLVEKLSDRVKEELMDAIDHEFVDKFYFSLRM
ncbi:MAG: HNH endonuclease domain-containing protein [Erysipelotrichaceae bacterium]